MNKSIKRLITIGIIASSILLLPISANAEWKQDSNGWWNTEGNSWSVGWKQIDGKWYYFNNDGYMAHDTTIDGQYKVDNNGVWIQNTTNNVNNSTNTTNNINNGIINNGVININNSSTTENTGKIVGWREIDGKKYFYDANGIKVISVWVNVGGKWYYFDSNGVMARNTWFHDKKTNKSFYLQDDGSKAVNTIIDGKYKVDENGVWIGNVSESNSTDSNNNSSSNNSDRQKLLTKLEEEKALWEKDNSTFAPRKIQELQDRIDEINNDIENESLSTKDQVRKFVSDKNKEIDKIKSEIEQWKKDDSIESKKKQYDLQQKIIDLQKQIELVS